MSDFRRVTDTFSASPQITPADVAEAAALGFSMIINNRPDAEAPDQPDGSAIEDAATSAGLAYHAIPVTHAGFTEAQVEDMARALEEAEGPVLAFCRSGTRSTLLWSLTMAHKGEDLDAVSEAAAGAGYDVAPIRGVMEQLAARSGS